MSQKFKKKLIKGAERDAQGGLDENNRKVA